MEVPTVAHTEGRDPQGPGGPDHGSSSGHQPVGHHEIGVPAVFAEGVLRLLEESPELDEGAPRHPEGRLQAVPVGAANAGGGGLFF